MLIERAQFHFFGSREIHSLYVTIGLITFANGLVSVFVPIYFWKVLGFSFAKILTFYLLFSVYFIAAVFVGLPIMKRLTDKTMMLSSLPFAVVFFLGLGFIEEFPVLFWVLPAIRAVEGLLFNVGYHLSFTSAADDGYIGREVGARYFVTTIAGLAAPFLGGVLITVVGFGNAFTATSVILILAVLPLLFFPHRTLAPALRWSALTGFLKEPSLVYFNVSGVGYAIEVVIALIVWPLFMYLYIGDLEQFGGIVSIGLAASAVATYAVGFLSDAGARRRVLARSAGALAVIWAFRPLFAQPGLIIASNVAGTIANATLITAWSSQYYKIARTLADSGLFIVSRELLYHFARIAVLPFFIASAAFLSRDVFFAVSFIGAAVMSLFFLFANNIHTSQIDHNLDDYYLNSRPAPAQTVAPAESGGSGGPDV